MKRALIVLSLALLAAFAVFTLMNRDGTATDADGLSDSPNPAENDLAASSDAASPIDDGLGVEYPAPPAEVRRAQVERLADGDSFDIEWLDTGESDEVRLFGINAPEGDACFGDQARDILEALTDDQELLVESIERDEFGRVLANVWTEDLFVNLYLVENGAALALTDSSQYGQDIREAQSLAQSNQSGLWDPTSCGGLEPAQVLIAEIFENAPGPDNENPNGEWIDLVNVGDADADLTEWSIRDESTRHRFFFPNGFVLSAGATVRVFSGCGDDDATSLYWCDGDPVWNNAGDTAFLVNPDGTFVDTRTYSG